MLKINEKRLLKNLTELAQIGATLEGGVTRTAFSAEDLRARNWFKRSVENAGLTFRQDGAANQYATLPASDPHAKTLLCGSHLDTVPNGGRYDGALGVLAALEAIQTIKEAGVTLPVHLEVVNFTDEEGSILSLFGSKAVSGQLSAESFQSPRGGTAVLQAGMERLGITIQSALSAQRDPSELAGFLEVHIEQGTRLEQQQLDIGVVTSIVGIRSAWVTFLGEAAHAGAKPMADRKDALWGAADFVQKARQHIVQNWHPGVCNVGEISAEPGAFNIVPKRVKLALEFRHGTEPQLNAMQNDLFSLARDCAEQCDLGVDIEETVGCKAAPSAPEMTAALAEAAAKLGLTHTPLISFAGHDTQSMATITPSAMFFVPSVNGVSHDPAECTHDHDCVNAANVMLHTLLHLTQP